jgi:hypothetical protein
VVIERDGVKGVPVIADPDTHLAPGEGTGDIDLINGGDQYEPRVVVWECQRVWKRSAPAMEGIIVVTVRRFVHALGTLGGSSQPAQALLIGGQRANDLCSEPRSLLPQDVFEIDGVQVEHIDVGWSLISEPSAFFSVDHRARALAHELGHALFLGHGNGIDDNHDGKKVGLRGIRRYDEYCDPLGTSEDPPSPQCPSVMIGDACGKLLTELQIEQARAVASVMPGCNGVPCKD